MVPPPFRNRLPGVVTPAALARMAWAPSYRAPRAGDVLNPPPFVPPAQPSWQEIGARDLVVRDGRVESVSLSGRAFISLAGPLVESNPPFELRLVAVKWYLDELAVCPHLARVERLNLAGNRIGTAGILTLARSPFFSARYLDLSFNNVGADGIAALLAAPWSQKLRGLNLAGDDVPVAELERLTAALPGLAVDTIAGQRFGA